MLLIFCNFWFSKLTKKKELSEQKIKKQIETQLPAQLRTLALGALDACKDVRKYFSEKNVVIMDLSTEFHKNTSIPFFIIEKGYKDPCDKLYFATKCMYDFSPKDFLYPWASDEICFCSYLSYFYCKFRG